MRAAIFNPANEMFGLLQQQAPEKEARLRGHVAEVKTAFDDFINNVFRTELCSFQTKNHFSGFGVIGDGYLFQ